jgi:hypothetical protein
MFSPEQFLDMQVTETNDTKAIPVPVGEYTAVIEEVKVRQWQSKKDPSMSGLTLDVKWSIDDSAVKELLGRDKVVVNQGIMLDITDSGGLDMGKGRNISLGRLREATNLNVAGQPFSFMMLAGRVAKVNVSHRIDGENIFAEVKGVAKLG